MIALRTEERCRFGDADGPDGPQGGKGYGHIVLRINTLTGKKVDSPAVFGGKLQKPRFVIFFIDGGEVADAAPAQLQIV